VSNEVLVSSPCQNHVGFIPEIRSGVGVALGRVELDDDFLSAELECSLLDAGKYCSPSETFLAGVTRFCLDLRPKVK